MPREPRLSRLELRILETLWGAGSLSIREIQERLAASKRAAYTTVQTVVYRLERKGAVRRTRRIGNAHLFEAVLSPAAAHRRIIDELLSFFNGRTEPVMAHLIESGKLTRDDLRDAEKALRRLAKREKTEP
jgi:predicted transcriptional regulator